MRDSTLPDLDHMNSFSPTVKKLTAIFNTKCIEPDKLDSSSKNSYI